MEKTIFVALVLAASGISAGIVPGAYIANYASSYNAHVVNHALATPVASGAYVAPSPLVSAPIVAPAAPVFAGYAPAAPILAARAAPVVAAAPFAPYAVNPY